VKRFLLDTHVLIWFMQGDTSLGDQVRGIIADDSSDLYLSVVSLWEIVIKINIGKLKIDYEVGEIYELLEHVSKLKSSRSAHQT
jgi:PIN domain nuclease of toxin-antitoxin system